GDTLWGISEKFYRNKYLWPKLWELNQNNVTNPHQLTVGDVLVIYPMDVLMTSHQPPAPPQVQRSLYDAGEPLSTEYPEFFTFVADPEGLAGTGVNRIKVQKKDPLTGHVTTTYDEVREVGEVIASVETGYIVPDPLERVDRSDFHGKQLLSYNDSIIIRFTEDVAKILDSATHEDPDPYFREFPIYGLGKEVIEPDPRRYDHDYPLGALHQFKGRVTIVARVETLSPVTDRQRGRLTGQTGPNQDAEPVSYVGKITYSEQSITIGDRIFLFKSLYPGPERQIGGQQLHKAEEYRDVDQP
ncbi:MAG: LysM peptidoglycan-binding domain-containing protein, partial [Thermodesulfobacteriota bacterium]